MKKPELARVLMLIENSAYPSDPRVRQEAETLAGAGYRVSVICPARKGQRWRETIAGVRVYRYAAPRGGHGLLGYLLEYGYSMMATFLLSLVLLVREGFDAVHAANPPDTFVFLAAPYKLLGKQFIYDHHDLAPEMYQARCQGRGNRQVHRALLLLERLSCRLADRVITTNESHKAIEMDRDGVPAGKITVVRNGPDPNLLRPEDPPPGVRVPGKTVIGYAGVMGVQDGVSHLLKALAHLAHHLGRTDFRCLLIGTGDALPDLLRQAEQLRIADLLLFTGWMEMKDMPGYLSATDICVAPEPSNPYNDNSTMIKIMEYMALAKPTVAFDLPEHRFTAQDAALYVRPNDELELARAIAQLMDDPARREAMGAYGRRRVETELAWEYSAARLLQAYRTLAPDRASGDARESRKAG